MYHKTLNHFAELGYKKSQYLKSNPLGFFVGSILAGAYVGFGIILIFSIGAQLDPAWQKLVMGLSFGIALTLVVFAGAELFTGHTMYMTLSGLKKLTRFSELFKVWLSSWTFNLLGSIFLALIFVTGDGGILLAEGNPLLNKIASYKMNSSIIELIARAILCNWLVCLALWMSARTENDAAKAMVIFWCLFAFIASGYEHCVANMTLFSIALLGHPTESITVSGMFYNLGWVTLGNILGGSLFISFSYWLSSNTMSEQISSDDLTFPVIRQSGIKK